MSVFIYQPDALDIMATVEGERWKKYQLNPRPSDSTSFIAFLEAWKECRASASWDGVLSPQFSDWGVRTANGDGAIYGDGGWTRYTVRLSGAIWFIEAQSPSQKMTERARAAGFTFL